MASGLKLHTFQIGTPPRPEEGLRISVARRPPRGVPHEEWRKKGYFDVWLPVVAPSQTLLSHTERDRLAEEAVRDKFFAAYRREMQKPETRHTIAFLAAVAQRTPISIGCFCEEESCCHRSVLKQLIEEAAAEGEV